MLIIDLIKKHSFQLVVNKSEEAQISMEFRSRSNLYQSDLPWAHALPNGSIITAVHKPVDVVYDCNILKSVFAFKLLSKGTMRSPTETDTYWTNLIASDLERISTENVKHKTFRLYVSTVNGITRYVPGIISPISFQIRLIPFSQSLESLPC